MKRLFGLLACLLLAPGLVPSSAFATGNTIEIGGEIEKTLAEAIAEAVDGDTILLTSDVALDAGVAISGKNITIDLGGYTLSKEGNTMIDLYSGLTLKNGNIAMTKGQTGAAIWLNGSAQLTVESDVTISATDSLANKSGAIAFWKDCNGATLNFYGTVTGEKGIDTNGEITADAKANTVNIGPGAKINVEETGMYIAGLSNVTITDSEISGITGVEIRAGDLTINNSIISGSTDENAFVAVPNGGGSTVSGAGLAVSHHTTNQPINVTVNDSTLTGVKAFYEADLQDADGAGTDQITLNLASGHYHGVVESANKTAFINGGVFTVQPEADLVAPAKTEASVTTDGTTTYFIGEPAYVASEIAAVAQEGSSVEVTQGDLALENIPAEVTVKNSGDGAVSVNHIAVPTGESVTTVVKTDSEGISPQTSDLSLIAILALMAGALLTFVAAYRSQKVRA